MRLCSLKESWETTLHSAQCAIMWVILTFYYQMYTLTQNIRNLACGIVNANEVYGALYPNKIEYGSVKKFVYVPKCLVYRERIERQCSNFFPLLSIHTCEKHIQEKILKSKYNSAIALRRDIRKDLEVNVLPNHWAVSDLDIKVNDTWNGPRLAWDASPVYR